jgi:hypothetical protein
MTQLIGYFGQISVDPITNNVAYACGAAGSLRYAGKPFARSRNLSFLCAWMQSRSVDCLRNPDSSIEN